jgi:hypothetical protein
MSIPMCLRRLAATLTGVIIAITLFPLTTSAAQGSVKMFLRPHCEIGNKTSSATGFGGPMPENDLFIGSTSRSCTTYIIKNPQTLQTGLLKKNEILDMDLVLDNIDKTPIRAVRMWLSYDPSVLEGVEIKMNPAFSLTYPGELDFFPTEGYAKIATSMEKGEVLTDQMIVIARIKFKVLDAPTTSTLLSFYDASGTVDAHTAVMSGTDTSITNVTAEGIGTLSVRLSPLDAAAPSTAGVPASSSSRISSSSISSTGSGSSNIGTGTGTVAGTGSAVTASSSVSSSSSSSVSSSAASVSSSSVAVSSTSSTVSSAAPAPSSSSAPAGSQDVFSILQVQGTAVTTDGGSAFLAWKPLKSSELVGYNVYYGTVSGQYLQRRAVDVGSTSVALRGLPLDTRYFFAIRGVRANGDETAFSQEIAIVIGDPSTSTSPLTGALARSVSPPRTLAGTSVAGETGLSSSLVLLLLVSAAIGTLVAFRRQGVAMRNPPHA